MDAQQAAAMMAQLAELQQQQAEATRQLQQFAAERATAEARYNELQQQLAASQAAAAQAKSDAKATRGGTSGRHEHKAAYGPKGFGAPESGFG